MFYQKVSSGLEILASCMAMWEKPWHCFNCFSMSNLEFQMNRCVQCIYARIAVTRCRLLLAGSVKSGFKLLVRHMLLKYELEIDWYYFDSTIYSWMVVCAWLKIGKNWLNLIFNIQGEENSWSSLKFICSSVNICVNLEINLSFYSKYSIHFNRYLFLRFAASRARPTIG